MQKFGQKIFDINEQESARLEDVDGIGPKRRLRIKEAWAEQKVIRNIMVFLHSNGVSTSRAVRIYKTYGEGVRDDPRDCYSAYFTPSKASQGMMASGLVLKSIFCTTQFFSMR